MFIKSLKNKLYKIIRKSFHIKQKKCCICGAYFNEYLVGGNDSKVWQGKNVVGAGQRKAYCPKCGRSDRDRLVYLFFKKKFLPQLQGEKIRLLHIAPESHLTTLFRAHPEIEYTAGDKRCDGYCYPDYVKDMDVTNLSNILDNTFDVIVCNHVLEHVDNDITAMKEIYRVLKKGGIAILQVPIIFDLEKTFEDPTIIASEERFTFYGQNDHVRLYGIDYPDRLKSVGFNIEFNTLAKRKSKQYGLNPNEILFICHK